MIFVGLFLFIAIIIVALNFHNSSNLSQIEEYVKSQKCKQITYAKGSYKALCDDKILEVSNSFSVDIKKNSVEYKYKDIKTLDRKKLHILINDKYKINFKEEDELNKFYTSLEKKIRN